MKIKFHLRVLFVLLILLKCSMVNAQNNSNYPARYMGQEPTPTVTAPNGAVLSASLAMAATKLVYTEPTIEKISDNVWLLGGYSITNVVVVETKEGLVIMDSGDGADEGERIKEVIRKNISQKPIIAAIYTHSHYCMGTGVLVDNPKTALIVGHEKLNETVENSLKSGGAISRIPELGPVLTARQLVQFSNFLPDTGEDALVSQRYSVTKKIAFLPVNKTVKNGEIVNIGGTDFQFFTEYSSDDYSLTILMPKEKIVYNNFYWPGVPNLYTLRGGTYRDPTEWRNGLRVIRDLKSEIMLNSHARTVTGAQNVLESVSNYMDMVTLVYDQSIRGILQGLTPDELRYFVYQPKRLAEFPNNYEAYGEIPWYTPAVFYFQIGWFDRDLSNLHKLPPMEEAQRLVELMGGREKVLQAANESYGKKEFAWAAQLGNYLYTINSEDKDARMLLSKAYRQLGHISKSMIGRSFLLSEARAFGGETQIPIAILPKAEIIESEPAFFVDMFRVRIDPKKSENVEQMVVFNFTNGTTAGLHIRKGIAEYVADPSKHYRQADIVMIVSTKAWSGLYLNSISLDQAIANGGLKLTKGTANDLKTIMELFDKFNPQDNFTIIPLSEGDEPIF